MSTHSLTHLVAIGLDLAAIAYTLAIAARARSSPRAVVGLAVVLAGWLAFLAARIERGALLPASISGPAFLAVVLGFVGVVGAALWRGPARAVLRALGAADLQRMQGIRVFFGASFLAQAALGTLPVAFGVLDGATHITAGFLGLVAAGELARDPRATWSAWLSDLFGLLDILVVATTLALVLLPTLTPSHSMMYAVFLPAPLWLWFHVVSIARRVRDRRGADQARGSAHSSTSAPTMSVSL